MILGYNTNGFSNHEPLATIELLSDIGYRSIALTLDHGFLNPYDNQFDSQVAEVKSALGRVGMTSTVETGARYLLDPRRKHQPTLLSNSESGRAKRYDFLRRSVDVAKELDSECVSIWSGACGEECTDEQAVERMKPALDALLDYASARGQVIGFEPEPDMFIDTMDSFAKMLQWVNAPNLKLTLDIGHLFCQGEVPVVDFIEQWIDHIVNVHIEDIKSGIHEHLMFGEGEIHFPPIIEAFVRLNYSGPIHVELSRHSHCAPAVASQSYEFLSHLIAKCKESSA